MNWYKQNESEWKQIIAAIALEIKRDELMIEKDTIQSMFLLEIAKSKFPIVFKGGTSLSKGYDLIKRFSEDIDLSINRIISKTEKKQIKDFIIETSHSLGLTLLNFKDVKSKQDYNKYIFSYKSLFEEIPMKMIVETSYYQLVYPIEERNIDSVVNKYCNSKNVKLPITFEASNFLMNVQTIQRTFIDKIFAICDYYLKDKKDRNSRHLYDICKIINYVNFDGELINLIKDVRRDRACYSNNKSASSIYNISNLLNEIINSRYFEVDYKNITTKLLYEELDYDYVIKNGIAKVAKTKIFDYKF